MIVPPHPPLFKQTKITHPLFPPIFHKFPSQNTMLDPVTDLHKNHVRLSDHIGRISDRYDSYEATSYGSRARNTAQNYANYRAWNSMGPRLRVETKVDDDESEVCSPPLWNTSPSRSLLHGQTQNQYWSLSPTSRTQAIERGQRELMEMVRNMPESCYELSLKDIVEQQPMSTRQENLAEERNLSSESNQSMCRRVKEKKKNDRKAAMKRGGSIDNGGLLIKMVFPLSLGSKKNMQKNNSSVTNTSSKVSPRPQISDGSGTGRVVDKEWWKKKSSGSGESESGRFSSINSGSTKSSGSSSSTSSRSSSRRGTGYSPGCWPFFGTKKSKKSD